MKNKEEINKELEDLYKEFKKETFNKIIGFLEEGNIYYNSKYFLGFSIVVLEELEDLEKEYRLKDLESYLGVIYLTNFYSLYTYIETNLLEESFLIDNLKDKIKQDLEGTKKEEMEDLIKELKKWGLGNLETKIYNLIDSIIYNN